MTFDWDESKRISNLRNHDIDFIDVPAVFGGSIVTLADDRFDYGEERFVFIVIPKNTNSIIRTFEESEVLSSYEINYVKS